MKRKRGQQKLSFGMIFSIILIILFVSFAGYGIYKLIYLKEDIDINKFPSDLQDDVDDLWKGSYGEQTPEPYSLPKKVDKVCFFKPEYGNENLKLIEEKEGLDKTVGEFEIKHLDIESVESESDGELCIENIDGEIKLRLIKEENSVNVTIENAEEE